MSIIKDYIWGEKKKNLSNDIYFDIQRNKIEQLEYKILSKNSQMTKEKLCELLQEHINEEKDSDDFKCEKYIFECKIRMYLAEIRVLQLKDYKIIFQKNKNQADIKKLKFKINAEDNKRKIYYLNKILEQ